MAQYRLYRVLLPVALLGALAALVAIAGARTQTVGFQLTSLQTFSGDWRGYRGLTGDVNGDGRTDLIWSKTDDGAFNRLVVGLAGADGSFTQGPMSSFAGDWRTYRAYAGDFNGDGLTDLLWNSKCQNSDCSSNANIVVITLSNGDGTFAVQPNQVLGWSGWSQYRTRIGDVDGDGRDDAIFNYVGNGFSDTAPGANFIYAALADSDAVLTLQPL